MQTVSSYNQPSAPVCCSSPALLSNDVKTLSCGDWQQLGHQMLTFSNGECNSLLLFLLSNAWIPLGGTEKHLQTTTACIAFDSRCGYLSQVWAKCSTVYIIVHLLPIFLSHLRTLTWEHHLEALLLVNSGRWTICEIYFKQYEEIPKLHRAQQGVLGHSKSDPRPQSWIWATGTRNAVSPKLTLNLTHPYSKS